MSLLYADLKLRDIQIAYEHSPACVKPHVCSLKSTKSLQLLSCEFVALVLQNMCPQCTLRDNLSTAYSQNFIVIDLARRKF